jgi:hypothetical protein
MNFHDLRIGSGGAAVNLVLPFIGRLLLLLLPLFLSRKTHIFRRKTGWLASAALAKSCQGEPVSSAPALAARSGLYYTPENDSNEILTP